jgi:hypothetical protein
MTVPTVTNNLNEIFHVTPRAASSRGTSFSPEQIEGWKVWAQEQAGETLDTHRLFIIQKDTGFWIANVAAGRGYRGPFSKNEVASELGQFFDRFSSTTFISRYTTGDKPRKKTTAELLEEFSTRARRIVSCYGLTESYYAQATEEFVEAVCSLRKDLGEAARDLQIEEWLASFGNPKLLDFLAAVCDLQKPCAALVILGPGGIGKQLLSAGAASLFSTSCVPGDAEDVLDATFNDALVKSPIFLLDEGLKGRQSSLTFRSFIGNQARQLRRKFLPVSDLIGCPRLIVAMNDISGLEFSDTMNATSREAVAPRFLFVEIDDAPKRYLESLPAGTTDSWIKGGKFARHVLWLRDTHAFERGKRFIVEGVTSRLHRAMALANSGDSLRVLATLLNRPDEGMLRSKHLVIGNGAFMVNASELLRAWKTILPDEERLKPRLKFLIKDLDGLSIGKVRPENVRLHNVNAELVFDAAESLGIGDPEAMRKLVDGPSVTPGDLRNAKTALRAVGGAA